VKKKHLFFLFLIPLIFLIVFLVLKNPEEQKFFPVNVNGRFSISLPDFLHPAAGIDSSAALQYENEKENIFVLVYEITPDSSAKQISTQAYFKSLADEFASRLERGKLVKFYPQKIGGRNGFVGNILGTVDGTQLYYRIALVKNADEFYEVIIGTTRSRKSEHNENINQMINSIIFLE